MKSKANRLEEGKSQNAVQRNIVHAENIKKENNFFSKNRMDHFQLNPNHGNNIERILSY